ncbi:hypothetical protein OT109_05025 [Phycisphaeraceae bacterium D3-23]
MPFNRSDTYTSRIKAASKVGPLFSKRHLETLPMPWRIVMRLIGWVVVLFVIAMVMAPVVLVVLWLLGSAL